MFYKSTIIIIMIVIIVLLLPMSKEAYKQETLMEETKQSVEAVKCIAAQWVIQPQENGA